MSDLPKPVPVIGGPLHGCMHNPITMTLMSMIPPEVHRRSVTEAWGRSVSDERILTTEYRLRDVQLDWGALVLRGRCYVWNGGPSGSPTQLLMSIVAWGASNMEARNT